MARAMCAWSRQTKLLGAHDIQMETCLAADASFLRCYLHLAKAEKTFHCWLHALNTPDEQHGATAGALAPYLCSSA